MVSVRDGNQSGGIEAPNGRLVSPYEWSHSVRHGSLSSMTDGLHDGLGFLTTGDRRDEALGATGLWRDIEDHVDLSGRLGAVTAVRAP